MLKGKYTITFVITYPITTCCKHLFGEEHTINHRIGIGIVVMIVGVCIAKTGHFISNSVGQYAVDLIGYGVHGTGLAPILDHFSKQLKNKN